MCAKRVSISLERNKDSLVLKLIAEGEELDHFDKKMAKNMEEIKMRAAAIKCIVDIQQGATSISFIAAIKHR